MINLGNFAKITLAANNFLDISSTFQFQTELIYLTFQDKIHFPKGLSTIIIIFK